jgi:uncharacterized protein YjbI with pentapeptide repeats
MQLEIKKRWTAEVIFKTDAIDFRAAVSAAVKAKADLRSADLRSANLCSADLCSANLRSADLRSADLCSADLRSANLCSAELTKTQLPAPTMVLMAAWGEVSAELCADLMMYDASCHPDQNAFDEWAAGGPCPYTGVNFQRACNFLEKKELWGKGKFRKPYNLMMRLFREKQIKF